MTAGRRRVLGVDIRACPSNHAVPADHRIDKARLRVQSSYSSTRRRVGCAQELVVSSLQLSEVSHYDPVTSLATSPSPTPICVIFGFSAETLAGTLALVYRRRS
jgi:hypothetical protein